MYSRDGPTSVGSYFGICNEEHFLIANGYVWEINVKSFQMSSVVRFRYGIVLFGLFNSIDLNLKENGTC